MVNVFFTRIVHYRLQGIRSVGCGAESNSGICSLFTNSKRCGEIGGIDLALPRALRAAKEECNLFSRSLRNVFRNVYLVVARALKVNASDKLAYGSGARICGIKARERIKLCYVCGIFGHTEANRKAVSTRGKVGSGEINIVARLTCKR